MAQQSDRNKSAKKTLQFKPHTIEMMDQLIKIGAESSLTAFIERSIFERYEQVQARRNGQL